jgi:integrase
MVEAFALWLQTTGHGGSTVEKYTFITRRYLAWCASHETDYLTADRYAVTAHLGDLARRLRPATVDAAHTALRVFYDFLIDEALSHLANPARGVKRRKRSCRPTEAFTADELRRLFDAVQSHREHAILLILINTGLRRSEIIAIKRNDLNWESGVLTVFGKGSKWRQVRLTPMTMEALAQALAFDESLFPHHAVTFHRLIASLGERARIRGRMHPHRFRKTMATLFLDAGGTVEELMVILGHETVGMSLAYAEAGKTQRALARMSEIDLASRLLGAGNPPRHEQTA